MNQDNSYLQNKMELLQWSEKQIPAIIYCHSQENLVPVLSHWHKEIEISCLFSGSCSFCIEGKQKIMGAGEINLVNSECLHSGISLDPENTKAISIHFKDEFLEKMIPDHNTFEYEISSDKTRKKLYDILYELYILSGQEISIPRELKRFACICNILAVLYGECAKKKKRISGFNDEKHARIKEIIFYLNEHCCETKSTQELASHFNFSREYFSRFFKNQTGLSVKDYIIRCRVIRAKEALIQTDKRLADISAENGFGSETQFIQWFKKIYGITPAKYRLQQGLKKMEENVTKQI